MKHTHLLAVPPTAPGIAWHHDRPATVAAAQWVLVLGHYDEEAALDGIFDRMGSGFIARTVYVPPPHVAAVIVPNHYALAIDGGDWHEFTATRTSRPDGFIDGFTGARWQIKPPDEHAPTRYEVRPLPCTYTAPFPAEPMATARPLLEHAATHATRTPYRRP